MISQSKNRVQAIKSKFENLSNENTPLVKLNSNNISPKLNKVIGTNDLFDKSLCTGNCDKENSNRNYNNEAISYEEKESESDTSSEEWSPRPNTSYLYSKNEVKRSISDTKKCLTRQTSDPGKKLHRSHAFRCDRSQKIVSPKRHGSCNGRSETGDFSLKMGEKKLSKDRLKRLGNLLEDQMRKDNFIPINSNEIIVGAVHEINENSGCVSDNFEIPSPVDSIPDSEVPQHILDQYAKVVRPKRKDEKQDAMTDSGVSSETENLDDEKTGKIKKLMSNFEKTDSIVTESKPNLELMNGLCVSSETVRLERKNPHLILTDTLKKALKQPLPPGPPPKKPPRTFTISPIPENQEKKKKDTKKMLEKLEQVLQKREAQNPVRNEYDIAETNLSIKKPKEIHYLCTEILDITHRTLLPNQNTSNCFKSLNCAIVTNNSTLSLPYTRLSNGSEHDSTVCCSCSNDNLEKDTRRISSFFSHQKCIKCQLNEDRNEGFKCHLKCKCKMVKSEFFIDKEHIYDEPFGDDCDGVQSVDKRSKSVYGTLNHSKSLEDLRVNKFIVEDQIYDIPCDMSRPPTPDTVPKSDFEKLRLNFEKGFDNTKIPKPDTETKTDCKKINTEILNLMDTKKTTGGETGLDSKKIGSEKPPMKPKPVFIKNKVSRSIENIAEDVKDKSVEKKFATDTKRYRKDRGEVSSGIRWSLPKKDNAQLDVDRENLNRLMTEIYETVTAACNMDENKPGSFPTDHSDGSTSEDSVKLTRSLTEKRKNYVRRVSSRVAYLDQKNIKATRFRHQTSICSYKSELFVNPYSTFRSWKSFRASQSNLTNKMVDRRDSTDSKFNLTDSRGNILSMKNDFDGSMDNLSIDEKTGCVDIELPFEARDRGLFNVCLLVGLNYMTGQAYVKSVFPSQVQVPPHIENLIFPETLSSGSRGEWSADAKGAQCYSLVLTDERGERSYGYCRRVLPEGATTCLPLCYCLIGKYRAPGFYYKVLQEIESHHGSSEVETHSVLQQLFETDFPNPGEEITISYTSKKDELLAYRNSVNLGDIMKCQTMPDMRRGDGKVDKSEVLSDKSEAFSDKSEMFSDNSEVFSDRSEVFSNKSDVVDRLPEFYDLENNNGPKRVVLRLEGPRTKILKRPIEPRFDEDNLSVLLDCLGAGLTIKVFGSLLLERKVLIVGDKLSLVSSCMEALQNALYPFVWQQPLISAIPSEIQRDVLEAPLPILAGMLKTGGDVDTAGIVFEEGMLIDLNHPSKVLFYQGDESTILPTPSYKTLKASLHMEAKHKDKPEDSKTRNVMISEGFLRFFVDILGDFWRFFAVGELKEGGFGKGDVVFDKETFIKNSQSKQNQYFLEWFTETAMFNHFIQNMAACYHNRSVVHPQTVASASLMSLVDAPLPDFYELFDERVRSRSKTDGHIVDGKNNYKSAMNKRVKLLKNKLRDLVA